jgi:acyl transferase domain-containing protein
VSHSTEPQGGLSTLQRAYLKIVELEARLDQAERRKREPIAIIGMACRFPGGVANPRAYWELLANGRNAITEIPRDRWDVDALYSPDPQASGKMYTRWGGFLDQVDLFDPQFFSITPREAIGMDPQQRLLLEVTWEALEHAGVPPDTLHGTTSGVFIGTGFNDYARLLAELDLSQISAYSGSGIQLCFCAGRISYSLGLQGPSVPVDTACSSSLVAVHQACRSLGDAECDLALAGGVNLLLAPEGNIFLSKAGALAPDGLCKTFDESANGFVRGEGCGVVVLKRLGDAVADGDNVLAVIAGSAVNHDGRSSGLTVPSGPAQEKVIRRALANAGIDPDAVGYIEAHGTGTPLGDPIEMQSLAAVFGGLRPRPAPLVVGSVKTNFGHLEAAAGVASLIKVVLMLQHRQIPPHLHFRRLNPHIQIDPALVRIPTETGPWVPSADGVLVAGISSFGLSGTNAHVMVREAPPSALSPAAPHVYEVPATLVLSARKPEALHELARAYGRFLSADEVGREGSLTDVCYSAATGRSHHDERLVVLAESRDEAVHSLEAFARGEPELGVFAGRRPAQGAAKLAFIFCGQGPQYPGMGRELFEREPVFRSVVEQCHAHFSALGFDELLAVLADADDCRLRETRYAQAAIFTLQVALAAVWRSWGVEPDAVVGHSLGEVAAAHVAGVLDLSDAVRVARERARVCERLTGTGRMASVALSPDAVRAYLAEIGSSLSIAAINGPRSTVLSGPAGALADALEPLRERQVPCRDHGVDYAFHSDQVDPLERELVDAIGTLAVREARVPIVSTVTGQIEETAKFDARYWGRNLRSPVHFVSAVGQLADDGFGAFVELGPHPILRSPISQCLAERESQAKVLGSIQRDEPERLTLKKSAAQLYTLGHDVRWQAMLPAGARRVSDLPTYPWQRQRYWLDVPHLAAPSGPEEAADDELQDSLYEVCWTPQAPRERATDGRPATWLILADRTGVGQAVAAVLEARGHRCSVLRSHDALRNGTAPHEVSHEGILRNALGSLLDGQRDLPIGGVIHLWALESTPPSETTADSLLRDQRGSLGSALQIMQLLAARGDQEPPRLWLVTRGAQAPVPGADALALAQAPLWGLGRTCAAELPKLWGGLIDLDPSVPAAEAADQVVRSLLSDDHEDQTAFRRGDRYVVRVKRVDAPEPRPFVLATDATYLVTGGRSGVGLEVARWLARNGAGHLVLAARTPVPPPETWGELSDDHPQAGLIRTIGELRALGVGVQLPALDVSDERQLTDFLERHAADGYPPVRGIFHAASVWRDAGGRSLVLPIPQTNLASVQEVFPPKVIGSWLLHRLLGPSLDLLVLFSSGASIVGSVGQGVYAAANAFLDALAHDLTRQGGPRTIAVNWGPITGTGFAMTAEGRALVGLWERRGIGGISPEQLLDTLRRLIPHDMPQLGVMKTDWARLTQTYAELLAGPWASQLARVERGEEEDLLRALERSAPRERKEILVDALRRQVCLVMGLRPEDAPEPHQGLFELGMDSLLSLELKNHVQHLIKGDFPATAVFDHPTVDALADYLLSEVFAVGGLAADTAGALGSLGATEGDDGDVLAMIEGMSDDEVKARLQRSVR